MTLLNNVLCAIFDVLDAPFAGLPALVGIVVWSLIAAVVILLVFKRTSDQDGLAEVKKHIHSCLFEIRLFNDDLRTMLRAQLEILGHNLNYLRLSFKPMLWMIVPLVLVIAQLQFHYGYQGLRPGDESILTLELVDNWADRPGLTTGPAGSRPDVDLEVPEGLHLATPGVWVPALNEITWRLVADAFGDYELVFKMGDGEYTKRVRVTDRLVRLSPVRPSPDLVSQLTWPAETPLPGDGPIRAISIAYPEGEVSFLGWHSQWEYAWMAVFFVLSTAFAFALRNRFGVTI